MRAPSIAGPPSIHARVPACVHLDLDGLGHIYRVHGWQYDGKEDPIFETGLKTALDFFKLASVEATLFVVAEDLLNSAKRKLIEDAVASGHELASHSLTHARLSHLDRSQKRKEIFESRELIEREFDVKVEGFRAPAFDIDEECYELLQESGYRYDSSNFFQSSRKIARKLELDTDARDFTQLRLPGYGPLHLPFHPSYSLVLGNWYFRTGLFRFEKTDAPLVLLFHLTDFAAPLPNKMLHNWQAKFYTLSHIDQETKVQRCARMLEIVRRNYDLTDTNSLLAMRLKQQTQERRANSSA